MNNKKSRKVKSAKVKDGTAEFAKKHGKKYLLTFLILSREGLARLINQGRLFLNDSLRNPMLNV